ncbi:DUF1553 domain-containing protein [Planctomicrobium sp. SH664]|uniref:DUF1553 domain-containing protein n=1 Tax=Planctomicrobium sp. SH664 TaxID=3448125 RepID=UPI003F5BA5CA
MPQKFSLKNMLQDVSRCFRNRLGRFVPGLLVGAGLVACGGLSGAIAADATRPLSFERDIRPIFRAHCFMCHGEAGHTEGSLDVRLRRLLVTGGDSGAAIVPGKPDESLLIERVRSGEMPPGKETAKVTPAELATLERWIAEGALTARAEPDSPDKISFVTEEDREHWAYQPIVQPDVPKVQNAARVRNEIDAFVLTQLEGKSLTFSPEADRVSLARRAAYDLTGLPPTPEQLQAFVKDQRPDAYERFLDGLLESPRYGERWGRHWLDVAGYADSEGYNESDLVRADAFRYRDYVIRAFNADKPFDQFITEQLAGDELIDPIQGDLTPEQIEKLTATGFLRMAPDGTGTKNDNTELGRNAVITETIKIVSSSLLGLTVGCAECHDHRFDPIPTADYYRMRAIFEPAFNPEKWQRPEQRQIVLSTQAELEEIKRLDRVAKGIEEAYKPVYKEYRDWLFARELEKAKPEVREALIAWDKDPASLTEEQKQLLDNYPALKLAKEYTEGYSNKVRDLLAGYQRKVEYVEVLRGIAAQAASVRKLAPPKAFIRALTEPANTPPPPTFIFIRGNYASKGEQVQPAGLTIASQGDPVQFPIDDPALRTTGRRLAFARSLTTGEHPLVTRVLVNRFWMHHFGRGLVNTPSDFGSQGDKPTHPELLDWLARRFVADGWSLKKFHRLVMTSETYRQSSLQNEQGMLVDAENSLYWRMPLRRLEAEAVRDSILAVCGNLNLKEYGPPTPVVLDGDGQVVVGTGKLTDPEELRRSVYVQVRRSTPTSMLDAFDSPSMDPNCEARRTSTVALQSLVLMNSEFVLQQSERFAQRVMNEGGGSQQERVKYAWKLAFGSDPRPDEVQLVSKFLEEQTAALQERKQILGAKDPAEVALANYCQVLLNSNQLLYVD